MSSIIIREAASVRKVTEQADLFELAPATSPRTLRPKSSLRARWLARRGATGAGASAPALRATRRCTIFPSQRERVTGSPRFKTLTRTFRLSAESDYTLLTQAKKRSR